MMFIRQVRLSLCFVNRSRKMPNQHRLKPNLLQKCGFNPAKGDALPPMGDDGSKEGAVWLDRELTLSNRRLSVGRQCAFRITPWLQRSCPAPVGNVMTGAELTTRPLLAGDDVNPATGKQIENLLGAPAWRSTSCRVCDMFLGKLQ